MTMGAINHASVSDIQCGGLAAEFPSCNGLIGNRAITRFADSISNFFVDVHYHPVSLSKLQGRKEIQSHVDKGTKDLHSMLCNVP